jgi:hypothetical protein
MIKLLILLLSFNCLAQELNECGQTKEEWYEDDIRCFEVSNGRIYESHFLTTDPRPIENFFHITPEELETEYEKVD